MFASPKCFIFESFTIIVFFNGFIFCLFVFVNSRMRCADVLAENATDGHWVFAKAVFKSTVTGTVTLVRPGSHLCSLQYSDGTKVLQWFESGLMLFQKISNEALIAKYIQQQKKTSLLPTGETYLD